MADSDHSTRFVSVTRRVALWGGVAAVTGWTLWQDAQAQTLASPGAATDPAVSLWREWAAVHERVQLLCRRQQELEVALADRVDCLGTTVTVPGGEPVYVCSMEGLDRVVGTRTDMASIRAKVKAELASKKARFEAVAEEIGYFSGLRAEQEGFRRINVLLEELSTTPATSLAGVAGKLDAVMREGEAWQECSSDFPWPQIRSARDDLVRIGRRMTPGDFFLGT
ncbi:hypothetical protein M2281_002317 [Mesorhizobium soli]|uniref:hypothetical protein n=1 Tax=Pseudaminobacter soli (ex Li et al. 2025) TaxID=1295366 RepID=UPI00247496CE|nr:hypothetical protein [Mesorhizobium soli]MDH6231719.1 hypothetical protein [Mesorhizobium soli]